MKIEIAFFLVGVFLVCAPLEAQWVKVPPAKIPRTADNKPNLSASAPRLPDGKPDLSGIWEPVNNRYVQNIAADLKPEDVPYQPWAKALFDERKTGAHSKRPIRGPGPSPSSSDYWRMGKLWKPSATKTIGIWSTCRALNDNYRGAPRNSEVQEFRGASL